MRRCLPAIMLAVMLSLSIMMPLVAAETEPYRLDTGDVIAVYVWGHDDLRAEVTVGPDGRISLPLVGEIMARGASLAEIEASLTAKYAELIKEPAVTVTLVARRQISVKVFGQVNHPGAFTVYPDASIAELIAMAGGPTERAALEKVQLMKDGDPSRIVTVPQGRDDRFGVGQVQRGPQLQDGDVIFVPETKRPDWERIFMFLGGLLTLKKLLS